MLRTRANSREIARQLRRLCPYISMADFNAVIDTAVSPHLRALPPSVALWQALSAYIRHEHTEYDRLLADGYDRDAARFFVLPQMNEVLDGWGCRRRIDERES
jgi:hypothetical protein